MHINSISCGQGAPSLYLIVMAGEGLFPADLVIVADTGWENDMLWNTDQRTTARKFFEQVTKPLALSYGIEAAFVRSVDENGKPYDAIPDSIIKKRSLAGTSEYPAIWYGVDIPLFGSNGGRLTQSCTSKWKVQAIRQELRRRGATTACCAQGLHLDEVHRVKPSDVKWAWLSWPLLDFSEDGNGGTRSMGIGQKLRRADIQIEMEKRGIPYLISSECDGCPHKNLARWRRTSPQTIKELAVFEQVFGGEMFLTESRLPLEEAIQEMEVKRASKGATLFDSCDSGYCFT